MALLSEAERKSYFKTLGLGEYNAENIKKVQKKYMLRKSDADGVYGTNTDNLLKHLMNCKLYLNPDNFKPEEFRCGCGGKHCCGYPTYMKPMELQNIQSIRTHYGKPMTITCGVRCKPYNKAVGGIQNSEHLYGNAVDYYISGVTDTLANRKKSIKWIKKLPNHHYTYGNGINSNGYAVHYPSMGNALHTDSYDRAAILAPAPTTKDGKLTVDGVGGKATVKAMQKFFGVTEDGYISGQMEKLRKYYPALTSVRYGKGGSATVKKLQKWCGAKQDGVLGRNTVKKWQSKIGVKADGIFGRTSMKAWQKYLNTHDKAVYPTSAPSKPTQTTSKPTPKPQQTTQNGNITATQKEIVAKAKSLVGSSSKPTTAFKTALNKAYPKRSSWGKSAKKGKSCDVFVGTVVRSLGIDKKYPRGLAEQYLYKPSGFERKTYKNVTPYSVSRDGDIIIYSKNKVPTKKNRKSCKGHTCIRGNGVIYEANYPSKYPHINKKVKKKLNVKRPYVVILRAK